MEADWTVIAKKTRKPKSEAAPETNHVYTPPHRSNNSRGGYVNYHSSSHGSHNSFSRKKYEPVVVVGFITPEEEKKFTQLQIEIPHLMMPGHIRKIQKKINIDELADKLLSDEWIEYQREGWVYERVIKPDETGSLPDGDDYDIRPLGNKWGDVVLFKKA